MRHILTKTLDGDDRPFLAPIKHIIIQKPNSHKQVNIDALFDTGCFRSGIPLEKCKKWYPEKKEEGFGLKRVGIASGKIIWCPTYPIRICVPTILDTTLMVCGYELPYVLIGNDFFNKLKLLIAIDYGSSSWYLGKNTKLAKIFLKGLKLWQPSP